MRRFDLNQQVSSHLAIIFIFLLSFIVAWYSVSAGENIVKNAREAETFSHKKQLMNLNNDEIKPKSLNKK